MTQLRILTRLDCKKNIVTQYPPALFLSILDFLGYEELCKTTEVSKEFKRLSDEALKRKDNRLRIPRVFQLLNSNVRMGDDFKNFPTTNSKALAHWGTCGDLSEIEEKGHHILSSLYSKIDSEPEEAISDICSLLQSFDLVGVDITDILENFETTELNTDIVLQILDGFKENHSIARTIGQMFLCGCIAAGDMEKLRKVYSYCKKKYILEQENYHSILLSCVMRDNNLSDDLLEFSQDLINDGADPNFISFYGNLLTTAIFRNNLKFAEFLLKNKANPQLPFTDHGFQDPGAQMQTILEGLEKYGTTEMKELFETFLSAKNENPNSTWCRNCVIM